MWINYISELIEFDAEPCYKGQNSAQAMTEKRLFYVYQSTCTPLSYRRNFDTDSPCFIELHHRHLSYYYRHPGHDQMIYRNIKRANDNPKFHRSTAALTFFRQSM